MSSASFHRGSPTFGHSSQEGLPTLGHDQLAPPPQLSTPHLLVKAVIDSPIPSPEQLNNLARAIKEGRLELTAHQIVELEKHLLTQNETAELRRLQSALVDYHERVHRDVHPIESESHDYFFRPGEADESNEHAVAQIFSNMREQVQARKYQAPEGEVLDQLSEIPQQGKTPELNQAIAALKYALYFNSYYPDVPLPQEDAMIRGVLFSRKPDDLRSAADYIKRGIVRPGPVALAILESRAKIQDDDSNELRLANERLEHAINNPGSGARPQQQFQRLVQEEAHDVLDMILSNRVPAEHIDDYMEQLDNDLRLGNIKLGEQEVAQLERIKKELYPNQPRSQADFERLSHSELINYFKQTAGTLTEHGAAAYSDPDLRTLREQANKAIKKSGATWLGKLFGTKAAQVKKAAKELLKQIDVVESQHFDESGLVRRVLYPDEFEVRSSRRARIQYLEGHVNGLQTGAPYNQAELSLLKQQADLAIKQSGANPLSRLFNTKAAKLEAAAETLMRQLD